MMDSDRIERAIRRLRQQEAAVEATKAEIAQLLGLAGSSRNGRAVDAMDAAESDIPAKRPGLGEKGLPILRSLANRGGTARMRAIVFDVTGQEEPDPVEAKRVRSAMFHLQRGRYVTSPERAIWQITDAGKEIVAEKAAQPAEG